MTRTFLTRTGIATALAGLGILALASFQTSGVPGVTAQGAPPPMPTVYYGTAAGATVGANVTAMVESNGRGIACGQGKVLNDGGPVYTVQVLADGQRSGCGASGRQVRFYVSPGPNQHGVGGRVSNSVAWTDVVVGPVNFPLNLGAPLAELRYMQMATKDGFAQ